MVLGADGDDGLSERAAVVATGELVDGDKIVVGQGEEGARPGLELGEVGARRGRAGGGLFARGDEEVAGACGPEVAGGAAAWTEREVAAEEGGAQGAEALSPLLDADGHGHLLSVQQAGAGEEVAGLLEQILEESAQEVALDVVTPGVAGRGPSVRVIEGGVDDEQELIRARLQTEPRGGGELVGQDLGEAVEGDDEIGLGGGGETGRGLGGARRRERRPEREAGVGPGAGVHRGAGEAA